MLLEVVLRILVAWCKLDGADSGSKLEPLLEGLMRASKRQETLFHSSSLTCATTIVEQYARCLHLVGPVPPARRPKGMEDLLLGSSAFVAQLVMERPTVDSWAGRAPHVDESVLDHFLETIGENVIQNEWIEVRNSLRSLCGLSHLDFRLLASLSTARSTAAFEDVALIWREIADLWKACTGFHGDHRARSSLSFLVDWHLLF